MINQCSCSPHVSSIFALLRFSPLPAAIPKLMRPIEARRCEALDSLVGFSSVSIVVRLVRESG